MLLSKHLKYCSEKNIVLLFSTHNNHTYPCAIKEVLMLHLLSIFSKVPSAVRSCVKLSKLTMVAFTCV